MKLHLYKTFLYITLITLFLPAFALPIVINNFCITVFFVMMIAFLFYYAIFHYEYFNKNLAIFLKFKATQFFFIYFFWLIIISLIHIFMGDTSFVKSFLSLLIRFINIFFPFFIGFIFIKNVKNKKAFYFVYFILWGILLFGIFDFIAFYFDVDILKSIFNFFVNRRLIIRDLSELKAMVNYLPRIQSVFEEPCHLAAFICAFLPFIYKISFSKIKITSYRFINKFLKFFMPFIAWLEIIGTFSPIYLIIAIILTIFYILIEKGVKFKLSYNNIGILIILLYLVYLFFNFFLYANLTNSVLLRIQAVIKAFTDINILILAEQSLGRRLIDIINEFILFIKNPILGTGPSSLGKNLYLQLLQSPVVSTLEVNRALLKSPDNYLPTPNIFFSNLAESGIIGITTLYLFFISIFRIIKNVLKYLNGELYIFGFGLKYFVLLYIILSFYDSQLTFPYGLTMFGIVLGFIYNLKINSRGINENINS